MCTHVKTWLWLLFYRPMHTNGDKPVCGNGNKVNLLRVSDSSMSRWSELARWVNRIPVGFPRIHIFEPLRRLPVTNRFFRQFPTCYWFLVEISDFAGGLELLPSWKLPLLNACLGFESLSCDVAVVCSAARRLPRQATVTSSLSLVVRKVQNVECAWSWPACSST